MSSESDQSREAALKARIASLRERYAARAGETRAALLDALRRGDRKALRDQAHRLAGSSATFGFPEIGEAAFAVQAAAEGRVAGAELTATAKRLADLLDSISS